MMQELNFQKKKKGGRVCRTQNTPLNKQAKEKKMSPGALHQEEQVITQMLLPNGING